MNYFINQSSKVYTPVINACAAFYLLTCAVCQVSLCKIKSDF